MMYYKYHTHVKKVKHTSKSPFGIYWWALKNQKNQNFESICRCHHFKLVPQKTTKWCMLTQIWSATDIIFCHFIQFFTLLPHYWSRKLKFGKSVQNTWWYYPFTYVHHKSRSYYVWFLRYKVQRTKLFVILGHFLPFDPPNNSRNKNSEKAKKCLEILSFYTCVPQMTFMMHGSWYIKHDRQNWLSFWATFLPPNNSENQNFEKNEKSSWRYDHFTQGYYKWQSCDIWFLRYLLQQTDLFGHLWPFFEMKISKKWKKHLKISSLYRSVPKIMIIGYTVPEIWCVLGVTIIFHFDPFFTLSPTNSLKNQNIKKMKKAPGDIIILY